MPKIEQIYDKYFEIVEDYYGRYFKQDNPIESVNSLLKKPMTARILYQTSDTIVEEIDALFKKESDALRRDMSSLEGINAHFCGNLSPVSAKRYISKTGLYVDTSIIADPLLTTSLLKKRINPFEFNRLFFKNAFNMLDLKRALINNSEKPILRIIPRSIFWKEGQPEEGDALSKTIEYFNELFNENFKDEESLNKFLLDNSDTDVFVSKIKQKNILKPAILKSDNLSLNFKEFLDEIRGFDSEIKNVSEAVYTNVKGNMVGNVSSLKFAKNFNLINSFDEINSWHYYNWFIKKQAQQLNSKDFVLNSITLDKVKWIGNLQIDDVIAAREKSCLQDFRDVLHKEITSTDGKDISSIASQVNYNLKQAFNKHEAELKQIESDFNFRYSASSTVILGGTISFLGGIATQNTLTMMGGGASVTGGLVSWIKTILDYNKKQNIINSPIGLLFEEAKNDR